MTFRQIKQIQGMARLLRRTMKGKSSVSTTRLWCRHTRVKRRLARHKFQLQAGTQPATGRVAQYELAAVTTGNFLHDG